MLFLSVKQTSLVLAHSNVFFTSWNRRVECRGDVLSTQSILIEIISPTLNFYVCFFFGFGLPFHCCTFPDFFRQLIGTWLTKIKLVQKNCTSSKIIALVHKQFVPWAKLNYKIYASTAAYPYWTTSLLPLMTSTFSTLIWQGLKKKKMNFSVSFEQAVLTCGLPVAISCLP